MPESAVDVFRRLMKSALAHKPMLQGKGFRAEIDADGHLLLTGLTPGAVTMQTIILPGHQVADLARWLLEIYDGHIRHDGGV